MADDKSNEEGSGKLPLLLGVISVLLVVVLLICTELIFDSSVRLNTLLLICCLFALLPFIVMKMSKKVATIGSIAGFVITLIVVVLLFWRRNKVTKLWIGGGAVDSDIAKKLVSYVTPSGVLVLASDSTVAVPPEMSKMDLDGADPAAKKKLAARLKKGDKSKSKDKGSQKSSEEEPTEEDLDTYMDDPNLITILSSTRLSGIRWQMLINISTSSAVSSLSDPAARKKAGFIDLK